MFYRYVIQTTETERLMSEFDARGVECKRPVYRPLHHYLNGSAPSLPNTERIYQRALSLPIYPTLRREEADQVMQAGSRIVGRRAPGGGAGVPLCRGLNTVPISGAWSPASPSRHSSPPRCAGSRPAWAW